MALSMDDMLERIGSCGWYQIRMILILSYMEWFNMTYQTLIIVFIGAEPPWHCSTNATNCTLPGSFKPGDDNYNYRCKIPRNQWEFSKDFTSVITEYELVCDPKKTFLASLSSSIVFAGWFVGAIVGGYIADRYGRKPIMFVSAIGVSLFGFLIAFPKVFWFYITARFFVGIFKGCALLGMFVILTEYVGPRHRHVSGTSLWFSWTVGLMSLAAVAYGIRDWRILSIVLGVVGFPVILSWCLVPESARFLLLKGEKAKTDKILRNIARVNKKTFPNESLIDPTDGGKKGVALGDFRALFHSLTFTYRTLIVWFSWAVNALVYYGVTLSTPDLGGSMYLNFFLTSVVEIPGHVASIWMMGKLGRKKTLVSTLIHAALAAMGAVLLTMTDPGDHKGYYAGRILMAMTAKFLVMISFDVIYVYTAELYPTSVRNVAMGSGTAAARIGAFSAPFIVTLNRIHALLPYGVMGVLALTSGVLCLILPETKDIPTPETMESEIGKPAEGATLSFELEEDKFFPEDNDTTKL